jgi:hypothetical protein
MTNLPRWLAMFSVSLCALAALFNTALILLVDKAPGAIAEALEVAWSVAPFVCLALLAILARTAHFSSWAVFVIVASLGTYDCISYWDLYCREYDAERLNRIVGFFPGGVLGFGLFVEWPAAALAALLVFGQRAFTDPRRAAG